MPFSWGVYMQVKSWNLVIAKWPNQCYDHLEALARKKTHSGVVCSLWWMK